MRALTLFSTALLLALPAHAGDWPSFRGERASGIAAGPAPPAEWSVEKGENIRWKTPIPGLAHASPIVVGGRVFVATAVAEEGEQQLRVGLYGDVDTTADEPEMSWRLYALDQATGEVVWQREAWSGKPAIHRHIKATHANSTPVSDGKRVVTVFGSIGLMIAYDLAGKELWRVDLGGLDVGWFYDPSYQWGHASSPVIWKDRLILQVDRAEESFIAAFRLADGEQLWQTARDQPSSWATPAVVETGERTEIVAHGGKGIRGYDAATGKELWRLGPTSQVTIASPVEGHGLVYVSNGYRPVQPIYAVRPGGSGDLSLDDGATSSEWIAWSHPRGGNYVTTPLVLGDHLYILADNGTLSVYDAKSGELVYKQRVGGGRAAFSGSMVAAGDHIYLPSEDGDVWTVRAGSEYKNLGLSSMGETVMTTPAIADGVLFVRTRGHLVAIGEPAAEKKETDEGSGVEEADAEPDAADDAGDDDA